MACKRVQLNNTVKPDVRVWLYVILKKYIYIYPSIPLPSYRHTQWVDDAIFQQPNNVAISENSREDLCSKMSDIEGETSMRNEY